MKDREAIIERLIELGDEREEAELALQDDDLWLVEPEYRFGFADAQGLWRSGVKLPPLLAVLQRA